MSPTDSETQTWQKGSAEMIVLALLEDRARHGYELAKRIESVSAGRLQFQIASLYPMLYRLERKGLVQGRWVEKAGERRRRFYHLTRQGRKALRDQRARWQEFVKALNRITGLSHA